MRWSTGSCSSNRPSRIGRNGALLAGLVAAAAGCKDAAAPANVSRLLDSTVAAPDVPIVSTTDVPAQYGLHDTFIRDGLAFACAWNTGLIIYDVGNGIRGGSPPVPVEISRIVTSTNASGLTTASGSPAVTGGAQVHNAWWFHNPVSGEQRYVFIGQEGPAQLGAFTTGDIHVVDVSDLAHPVEVAYYHMNVSPAAGTHNFWMDEAAQVLYAAYYNGGVVALDVSGTLTGNLASREIARYAPGGATGFVWGVQVANNSVYALDMISGFYQLKLSNGMFTTAAGGANVPERYSSDLWVRGNWAYTGTWGTRGAVRGNAIKIWSVDPTGAPTLADSIVIASIGTVSDVKGTDDGRFLVVTAESGPWGGLYVFSLASPSQPRLVGRNRVPAGLHTVKVSEINGKTYAFAARNPSNQPGGPPPAMLVYDLSGLSP